MARHGMDYLPNSYGSARRGEDGCVLDWQGKARIFIEHLRHGVAGHGVAGRGLARHGLFTELLWLGEAWRGADRCVSARLGKARHGFYF